MADGCQEHTHDANVLDDTLLAAQDLDDRIAGSFALLTARGALPTFYKVQTKVVPFVMKCRYM